MEGFTFLNLLRYALSLALLIALVVISIAGIRWMIGATQDHESGLGYVRLITEVVEKFVLAAEQYYSSGAGQEKKEWVCDQLEDWAKRRKIPFDRGLVEALIENAVYQVINGPKGSKVEEVKTALAVQNAGGDARSLPFVKGDADVSDGPPRIAMEDGD
jgi:hypothetical protein